MSAPVLTRTADLDRHAWLDARRKGIGGSDAAAILGLDPFRTPLQVYLDKTGQLPDDEPNEAIEWGNRLEGAVAQATVDRINSERAEAGLDPVTVRRRHAIFAHPDHEWMLANVDREVLKHEQGPGILEVKTTGHWPAQQWEDHGETLPDKYHVQEQHYLAVTGRAHGWIGVLVAGQRLVVQHVERDDELIDALVKVEANFWQRILDGNPPPAEAADDDVLKALWPTVERESVVLPDHARALVEERNAAKAAEDAAVERRKRAENQLRQLVGDAQEAFLPGESKPAFKYSQVSKETVDTKALAADHPGLVEDYRRDSSYRRFHFPKGD